MLEDGVDTFEVVLRGYDRHAVDQVVITVQAALRNGAGPLVPEAIRQLTEARFTVRLRGYNKRQVDDYLIKAEAELRKGQSA